MDSKMKKFEQKDLINLVLIIGIPLPCFFFYLIHFFRMFDQKDIVGQNVCLIITGAFLWGMADILWNYVSIVKEHNQLNKFRDAFAAKKDNNLIREFPDSIIGHRYKTVLSLKNSLSDIRHDVLREIITSQESGRAIVAKYFIGACVMLGLFGSFLGLLETVGGAYSAIEGIKNSDQLLSNLHRPLSGMSITFGTSIVGIIASLTLGFSFVFLNRRQVVFLSELEEFTQIELIPSMGDSSGKKFDAALDRLEIIEKNTGSIIEIKQGLRQEAKSVLSSIDKHYSNLTNSIQDKMNETMMSIKNDITRSFSSLTESTSQSIRELSSRMETSATNTNDSITGNINTFMANEKTLIQQMLDTVSTSGRKDLEARSLLMEGHAETSRNKMDEFLSGMMKSYQETIDSFITQWTAFFEQQTSRTIHDMEENTALLYEKGLKKSEGLLQQNTKLFSRTSDAFKSLGAEIKEMHVLYSERLNQTTLALKDIISGFNETMQQKQNTNKLLSEKNDQISTLLEESAVLLQGNQTEMQAAIAMFVQGIDKLLKAFQIKARDEKSEDAIVDNLEQSLNELTEKSGKVLIEYAARSREIYSGLLENQMHLARKIEEMMNQT